MYCARCNKYRNFQNTKILYIFSKTFLFSIFCDNRSSKDEQIFKEEESNEILKILGLINDIEEYQMNIESF